MPVSKTRQRWVRRSSSAVVIFASPKTLGHSLKLTLNVAERLSIRHHKNRAGRVRAEMLRRCRFFALMINEHAALRLIKPHSRIRRFRRQAVYIVLTTAAAIGALAFFEPHAPSVGRYMMSSGQAEHFSGSPRIIRGGDAWNSSPRASTPRAPASQRPAAAPGAQLIDVVTRVRDGDTIVVGLIPIRIANLDCAETGTAPGERATRRMTELVRGQQLTCQLEGRRSWDREVGVCALPSGRDLGEILIAERFCTRWR